jgi:hypothetical protein
MRATDCPKRADGTPGSLSLNDLTPARPSRPAAAPYAAGVDSTRITAAQAEAIAARVGPILGYVTRLRDRMQQRGWVGGDPRYTDVKAAQDALHRLCCTVRELARLRRAASAERRPWAPGGSGREGR